VVELEEEEMVKKGELIDEEVLNEIEQALESEKLGIEQRKRV
jgi:hypothetical protein